MLEYVASGMSYFRFNYAEAYVGDLNKYINRCLESLQDVGGHKFSLLYNAHTEKHFGPMIQDNFRQSIYDCYSDSGGLQIVTLGHKITSELKKNVYENQAKFSDLAMSFDEIPVVATLGGRAEKKDMKNRFFDRENFEERAKATGLNLLEQIRYFEKKKSKARPMFICHGNDYDTFMQWADIALNQIPKSLHARIGGIAPAGAAIGSGTMEDVKRAFFVSQIPLTHATKHIHLLGVGSVQRLLPALIMMRNGVYESDVRLSYDSTSHTSGPHIGRYYGKDGWMDFPKFNAPIYDMMYAETCENVPFFPHDREMFHKALNWPARKYQLTFGTIDPVLETFIGFITSEIMNFQRHVDEIIQKPKKMGRWCTPLQVSAFTALESVKTPEDFRYWETHAGFYVKSNSVAPYAPVSLKGIFE